VTKIRSSRASTLAGSVQRQILLPAFLLASSSVLLLTGCSSGLNLGQAGAEATESTAVISHHGTVYGLQSPIAAATVTLYDVPALASDAAGYAGHTFASPAALTSANVVGTPVTTSTVDGTWSYNGTCTVGDELLYVATGGYQVGNTNAVQNASLEMTAAAGQCGSEFGNKFNIDEVTTVVTEYALAGFSGSTALELGTSKSNVTGFTNAFATVNNLVNLSAGSAYSSTPAYQTAAASTTPDVFRSIVPADLIDSLADVLAGCVNENDTGGGTYCTNLFALTGSVANTADAALYIAHHPGNNVSAILGLPAPQNPFPTPTLSTPYPTDLTMTVNYVGGGLGGAAAANRSKSSYLAIDQNGDVWVNNTGLDTVIELNNLGIPQSNNTLVNTTSGALMTKGGYPAGPTGNTYSPQEIAIDQNGNAWIADSFQCLDGLSSSGAPLTGSPYNSGFCVSGEPASGVAVDASNNIWVAGVESGDNYVTALSYSSGTGGTILNANFPYTAGFSGLTSFLGPDYSGHMWYVDGGNGEYGALTTSGTLYATSSPGLSSPDYQSPFDTVSSTLELVFVQGDGTENIQFGKLGSSPALTSTVLTPNSEAGPDSVAVDGAGYIYFDNGGNGSNIPENLTVVTPGGAELSPSGIGWTGGSQLTALDSPGGLGIDPSGNVWVLNESNAQNKNSDPTYTNSAGIPYRFTGSSCGNLTEIIGLATPVDPVAAQAAAVGHTSGVGAAGSYGVAP
jgi:hypothetical protein